MAIRVAGFATLYAKGKQVAVRGNFTISPSTFERTMLAGQDYVHGYQELPRVPYIEADLTTMPGFRLDELDTHTDVSVTAQPANKMQYVLHGAVTKGGYEINTRDGQVRVRWEGLSCEEIPL